MSAKEFTVIKVGPGENMHAGACGMGAPPLPPPPAAAPVRRARLRSLPPTLACRCSPLLQLYRDCLRLADYISTQVRALLHRHAGRLAPPRCCRRRRWAPARCDAPARAPPPAAQGGNRRVLREQVRQAFKKNKGETDPQKIEEQKEA